MYVHDRSHREFRTGTRVALGDPEGLATLKHVEDATAAPYRWICALDVFMPSRGPKPVMAKSTGVLISPRHVLTAATSVLRHAPPVKTDRVFGERVDALKVTVTPGLALTNSGKPWAPVGSIHLKPGDWWIPDQYLQTRNGAWNVALLILPKELAPFRNTTYGHWSDPRYAPRTTLAPVTTSLLGSTVSFAGYVNGNCTKSCSPCGSTPPPPDSIPAPTGWLGAQAESYGLVRLPSPLPENILFTGETCLGMSGAPVWQNAGGLRLVALLVGSDVKQLVETPQDLFEHRLNLGLAMRPELVDSLRRRIVTDRVAPSF